MSLSPKQLDATRRELRSNLVKSGLEIPEIAKELGTSEEYIQQLLDLNPKKLEDTWILKNLLVQKVKEVEKEPTPFSALGGDYHVIWFLDADYIDGRKIY